MVPHTFLLSGIPRSGSSLCCRLAGELPDTVALSEPMRRALFTGIDDHAEACRRIEQFAREVRARIPVEHRAPSVQVEGRLDDDRVDKVGVRKVGVPNREVVRKVGVPNREVEVNKVGVPDEVNKVGVPDGVVPHKVVHKVGVPNSASRHGGLRQPKGEQGEILVEKPLSEGFTLLIKHNALFAALLPALSSSFPCLALIRNPVAVLASWQTVNLPVNRGRIPAGEQFDADLRARLEREPDALRRQTLVLHWFFDRFRTHIDSENVLRYEDLVESGGQALFRMLGRPDARPAPLENRNTNRQYSNAEADMLLTALFERRGAWSGYYSDSECEQVADIIRSGR